MDYSSSGLTQKRNFHITSHLLIVLLLIVAIPCTVYGAIPETEREALIALYNSTDGDNWTNNTGWKDGDLHTDGFALPGTEGSWYGVTVESNTVTIINFYDNNLSGNIPEGIGNLISLTYLELSYNQLTGALPAELGNLINLESLYIFVNRMTGPIPVEIGNLGNLKVLNLYSNNLTGGIPTELGNLNSLVSLSLASNPLEGPIPVELGNLSNLVFTCNNNR